MVYKHKHKLNSTIIGVPVMRDFKYRGKFNRMWKVGSMTIDEIINILYKAKNKFFDPKIR